MSSSFPVYFKEQNCYIPSCYISRQRSCYNLRSKIVKFHAKELLHFAREVLTFRLNVAFYVHSCFAWVTFCSVHVTISTGNREPRQ